jgi:hypothetical protein
MDIALAPQALESKPLRQAATFNGPSQFKMGLLESLVWRMSFAPEHASKPTSSLRAGLDGGPTEGEPRL